MGRIRAPIFRPNWSHPLNRGRVAWWLCQPNRLGGGTLFDLCGHYPGALTSMGGASGATNGFRSTTRPGGWGGMLFDGSAGLIKCPNFFGTILTGTICSVATWFYPTGSLTAYQSLFDGTSLHGDGGGRQLSAFLGAAANHIYVAVATSTGLEITLSDSWVLNQWQRLILTCDGSTITIYRNGRAVGSGATIGTGFRLLSADGWQIGGNPSAGGAAYAGSQDDVTVWSRALTAAEVRLDYTLSRQRYPGVLQSMPLRTYSVPSAGPAGNGLLMRRRRFLLGAA